MPHDPTLPKAGEIERWGPLLTKLLSPFDGALTMRFSDASWSQFGNHANQSDKSQFALCMRDPQVVRSLLLGRDPLRFVDAYFRGSIDVEGDLFAALSLKNYLQSLRLSLFDRIRVLTNLLHRPACAPATVAHGTNAPTTIRTVRAHSKDESRNAIAFHYDLSNDFYRLWLDENMVYSCAYFESPAVGLEQAQRAKLDHICRKLQLHQGERLLDIGCGWGALALHAAQEYGVIAHGITLSSCQYELAQSRIAEAGMKHQVKVTLEDYRDLKGQTCYDKIASVGMFEHVGLRNLPQYFDTVQRLLSPRGYFLNHGITHVEEGWRKTLSSRFINRYVFPDGELDTVSNIQRVMERAQFEIMDVESLRPHYARTLRHWVQRLEQHHAEALQYVSEATFRVWRLYMAASALEFEAGSLGVYQILATRRMSGTCAIPLTRSYMYPAPRTLT